MKNKNNIFTSKKIENAGDLSIPNAIQVEIHELWSVYTQLRAILKYIIIVYAIIDAVLDKNYESCLTSRSMLLLKMKRPHT